MTAAEWLASHVRSVVLCLVLLVGAGAAALLKLPVSLFPAIDFPRIAINVDAGDRSAERMLTEVTLPLEEAVRSVPGVRSVRSKTSRGSAELSVTFDWDHDMVAALLQVQAAVAGRSSELPSGIAIETRRMDPTVFPVLGYSLTSDTLSPVKLRDLAQHQVRASLSALPGVARVDVAGGEQEEVRVELDPVRLATRGITTQDVAAALTGWNVVRATGRLEDRLKLYLVMVSTPVADASDVAKIMVRGPGGTMVPLGDLARVVSGQVQNWLKVTADGHEAVLVQVYQQPGGNTVQLADAAEAALAELRRTLPAEVKVANWYDQSQLVRSSAGGLRDAVIIGAVLAGLVLLLFLRNLRVTLIAMVTVPGVLAAACLLLLVFKQTLNLMTLGGMAAAVGLIIDDAMVMIEHIVARIRAGGRQTSDASTHRRALRAAGEFSRPLLGASLATIVIHIPPVFLSGVTGEFFKALSLTIAVSLVVSFLMAWALVPIMAGALLSARDASVNDDGPVTRVVHRAYAALMAPVLRWPWLVLLPVAAFVFGGVWAYPRLATGFMPEIDEGGFVLDYKTHPGTSLDETDRLLRQIEAIIRRNPNVQTYSRRTGMQLGGGITEANEGDFFIRLKSPASARQPADEVMDDIRKQVEADVPGVDIEMAQLMEDLIGDLTAVPQPIEIKLYSEDQQTLSEVAPRVADAISRIPGVTDINNGLNIAGDALEIHVDPVKAGIEGLDAGLVADQAEKLLSGEVVSQYQVFGDTPKVVGIRLWSAANARRIEDDLSDMNLSTPDGRLVPLSRVATIERIAGQPQLEREDLRRMVGVTARISGTDLGSAVRRVQETLRQPGLLAAGGSGPGIPYSLGGLYREQQTAFVGLMWVFGAAVLLLLMLLVYWYESLRVAVCLVVCSLLAMPGVVMALWLTGTQLNIASMMGLAMIAGSVVEAGVFLCSEVLHPVDDGMDGAHTGKGSDARARFTAAALRRMRPIAMTTIAAILAMAPLIVGLGEGAAMLRPLAVVIVAGLVVQLPLVLVVLPAMLAGVRVLGRNRG
ncbi:MAG: AcrB/AcrD/AcrF family protein [Tepidisphaera sp.]|nr:AcrB/AcrD/AcrF family protein [Tepidisphaera sp.]